MQNHTLDSWLGAEDAQAPAEIIEQAEAALKWVVAHRISRCKDDFKMKYQDPVRRQKAIDESKKAHWADLAPKWLNDADGHDRIDCPACSSSGIIGGPLWHEEVTEVESAWPEVDEDGHVTGEIPTEEVEKVFGVDAFYCPVCGLRLFGQAEIDAADLPESFAETEQREREFEPDYGND
jgi:hypothetical protein